MLCGDAYAGYCGQAMLNSGGSPRAGRGRGGGATQRPRPNDVAARRVRSPFTIVLHAARGLRARPKLRLLAASPIQGSRALPQRLTRPGPLDPTRRRPARVELAHGRRQTVASQPEKTARKLPSLPPALAAVLHLRR